VMGSPQWISIGWDTPRYRWLSRGIVYRPMCSSWGIKNEEQYVKKFWRGWFAKDDLLEIRGRSSQVGNPARQAGTGVTIRGLRLGGSKSGVMVPSFKFRRSSGVCGIYLF
jgi:hypothetical protein